MTGRDLGDVGPGRLHLLITHEALAPPAPARSRATSRRTRAGSSRVNAPSQTMSSRMMHGFFIVEHPTGALVDAPVRPRLHPRSPPAEPGHLRVEAHAAVQQVAVERRQDLLARLDPDELAGLEVEVLGRRATADDTTLQEAPGQAATEAQDARAGTAGSGPGSG